MLWAPIFKTYNGHLCICRCTWYAHALAFQLYNTFVYESWRLMRNIMNFCYQLYISQDVKPRHRSWQHSRKHFRPFYSTLKMLCHLFNGLQDLGEFNGCQKIILFSWYCCLLLSLTLFHTANTAARWICLLATKGYSNIESMRAAFLPDQWESPRVRGILVCIRNECVFVSWVPRVVYISWAAAHANIQTATLYQNRFWDRKFGCCLKSKWFHIRVISKQTEYELKRKEKARM